MFSLFEISGSALTAQSVRMNVAASNLANAESVAGPDGEPYRARQVWFQAYGDRVSKVRVAAIVGDPSPMRKVYDPGHPLADEEGYVDMPNVKPVEEMVNMISAARSYQANIEVLNTSKQLMLKTLTLGER